MSEPEDENTGAEPVKPSDEEADRTRIAVKKADDAPSPEEEDEAADSTVPPPVETKPKAAAASAIAVGTLINNNYEVKEVLKAGGMGEVYRGENVFTGDPVAIKVILAELAEDEKVGLMFMREARTLSQLSDDAIVRYYNFVKDPALDRYFLIMEFIRGLPLSDYTAQNGPIPKEAALALMRRLAKGLDKAHARGVIHRDLSPDNVMLPDGIVAEALLIDFGIAKSNVLKEGTMAGQFAGKFKYVSPEQLGHYGGEIGPQTDIYGLALLMAAALLGKPLDMGTSIVEAVQARQSIPDISALPDTFRPIMSFMLEPDPKDRVESMAEVVRLLEQPEEIPAKYHAGLPPVPRRTTAEVSTPPMSVTGLLQPPTAAGAVSLAPRPMQQTSPAAPSEKQRSGLGVIGLLVSVFLLIAGGAVYYGWSSDIFGERPLPEETTTENRPQAPQVRPNSREGFLAEFDTGGCTFATRISAGANAGMVQGFATQPNVFLGLPTAYEEKFGARPTILESLISDEQCAVLDLMRGLQGRDSDPVTMLVNQSEVESGTPVGGQIQDPLGRNVWLALISPKGGVYNLTGRLSEPVGNRRSFRFGLSLSEGAEAAPQLLLAIATPTPLVNAAAASDGAEASALLPLIANEIAQKGGQGVAALSHILLVPPAPEPSPSPDPETESNPAEEP